MESHHYWHLVGTYWGAVTLCAGGHTPAGTERCCRLGRILQCISRSRIYSSLGMYWGISSAAEMQTCMFNIPFCSCWLSKSVHFDVYQYSEWKRLFCKLHVALAKAKRDRQTDWRRDPYVAIAMWRCGFASATKQTDEQLTKWSICSTLLCWCHKNFVALICFQCVRRQYLNQILVHEQKIQNRRKFVKEYPIY